MFKHTDGNLTLYKNGILQNSILTNGPQRTSGDFVISDDFYMFNGSIDEVLVYNRSLSQAEITALYNNYSVTSTGVNRTSTPSTNGLVLDINFDNFNVADKSGNGNHGTNTNVSFGEVFSNKRDLVQDVDYSIALATGTFTILNEDYSWADITANWNYFVGTQNTAGSILQITNIFIALTFITILLIPILYLIKTNRL